MKVHFIGIGGISMSGLAVICLNLGYSVSGSDSVSSHMTEKLEKMTTVELGAAKRLLSKVRAGRIDEFI